MAEIINLRSVRKARVKAEKAGKAQVNRAKFGRTKAEKLRDKIAAERAARAIDGAKREDT